MRARPGENQLDVILRGAGSDLVSKNNPEEGTYWSRLQDAGCPGAARAYSAWGSRKEFLSCALLAQASDEEVERVRNYLHWYLLEAPERWGAAEPLAP